MIFPNEIFSNKKIFDKISNVLVKRVFYCKPHNKSIEINSGTYIKGFPDDKTQTRKNTSNFRNARFTPTPRNPITAKRECIHFSLGRHKTKRKTQK